MAIMSHAFGRVSLTEKDAEKFNNQVRYGKPKASAHESVKKGVEMSRKLRDNGGELTLTIKRG